MERNFVHKVSGGKLLKIRLEYESGKIRSIRINGDFFAHPEDSIERLEALLTGKGIGEVDGVVRQFAGEAGVKFYGISYEDILYAIKEAVK